MNSAIRPAVNQPSAIPFDSGELLTHGVMGTAADRFVKRTMDVALALPVVVLALPVLCITVKAAQLLQSKGPLFYLQKRCGRNGREFTILKFRTMNLPAEGKTDIDTNPGERIYPLGKLLRRSKLDEIPQFVNVLLGSMSVVGPRPHHARDCSTFSQQVSEYTDRFVAKPGITGLAQYKEYRGDFEWNCVESRVARDLLYIREWSLMLDIRLIAKTVNIVSRRVLSGGIRRITRFIRRPDKPESSLAVFTPDSEVREATSESTATEKRAA